MSSEPKQQKSPAYILAQNVDNCMDSSFILRFNFYGQYWVLSTCKTHPDKYIVTFLKPSFSQAQNWIGWSAVQCLVSAEIYPYTLTIRQRIFCNRNPFRLKKHYTEKMSLFALLGMTTLVCVVDKKSILSGKKVGGESWSLNYNLPPVKQAGTYLLWHWINRN